MIDKLHALNAGLLEFIVGKTTLTEIEETLTTPIIIDDKFDDLDDNISRMVLALDMCELEEISYDDAKSFQIELNEYLRA